MNRLPLILAIDPALSCGWALGDVGPGGAGLIASGVWSLPGTGHPGDRFHALHRKLVTLTENHHAIAMMVYEKAFHRGQHATESHRGMIGIILAVAALRGIRALGVNASELKLHATGHGASDKAAMIRYAVAIFNRTFESSDEADAAMLYDFARRRWATDHLNPVLRRATV